MTRATDLQRLGPDVIGIRCDHREDDQVRAVFERVTREHGGAGILVNNVWGGYEDMVENGEFTLVKPFWQHRRSGHGTPCSTRACAPSIMRASWRRRV